MANKIKQIRFPDQIILEEQWIKDKNSGNYWSPNLLENLGSVIQLGIYALPGTEFRTSENIEQTFIINGSGLFSLNTQQIPLNYLSLNKKSYENILKGQHFIIIDLIYKDLGVQNNE